ncbi:hypothetical protein Dimus_030361 [Dionaea muscipula]
MKRENGLWWLGTGNNRRRDDEKEEVNVEENFDWEAVIDEYFDEVNDERPDEVAPDVTGPSPSSVQQKEKNTTGVDPSIPTGSTSDSDFVKLQVEFNRARAERLQAELGRAQAENARLQALLQQTKS